jgi:hypothetical protein
MANEFFDWVNLVIQFLEDKRDTLKQYEYSLETEKLLDEIKGSFIRVNLDSDFYLAQLLMTEKKYLHIDILDMKSEETLFSSRTLISNQIHLKEELLFFLSRVNPHELKRFYE